MIELLHTKPFTVRYYESGASRLVRPVTLLDYLQDAAAEHASILRIGVQDLHHLHEIVREKDGKELARLRISWA